MNVSVTTKDAAVDGSAPVPSPLGGRNEPKGIRRLPRQREGNRRLTMSVRSSLSIVELFLAAPTKSALLSLGPLALALGQLGNSYVNGVSPAVSIGFAVVMVAFAVVATRHHAAEHRLQRLESDLEADFATE